MPMRKIFGDRGAFTVVEIIMLVTVIAVIYVGYRQQQVTDCVRAYGDRQAAVNKQRAEAQAADVAALDELIRKSLEGGPAYRTAAEQYLATRAETTKKRQENPLPGPPSDRCGY